MGEDGIGFPAVWVECGCHLEAIRVFSPDIGKVIILKAEESALEEHRASDSVLIHHSQQALCGEIRVPVSIRDDFLLPACSPAAHAAADSSALFKAGQAVGNTASGRTDGKPNAHVQGRSTVGNIPRPVYNVQESGIVVVNIVVDNYGNVVRAVPGGDGTTVLDKTLYAAARNAAMDTHFNMSADAPAMQEGTITYYFNLK